MAGEKARVGVIGAGWWSTMVHMPALAANNRAELVAIADRDPQRLAAAANEFGVTAYPGHRELLDGAELDAVVIAVQHAYHFEAARDALDAGVSVMLEKPMTLNARDAWELVRLAREREVHLQLGYTYHFTRHARRAKQVLDAGELGELQLISGLFASMVESYYRGEPGDYAELMGNPITMPTPETYSNPAISGGGQAMTQITHAMGMVHWLTGGRTAEVFAFMADHGLAVDLVDAASYRFDDGTLGTMASTGGLEPRQDQQQELRYYGTEGYMLQEIWSGALEIVRNDGRREVLEPLTAEERYPAGATSAGIVDLVLGGGENLAPGEAGAAAVEFIELAYRSAREGRPVRRDELPL
ncbi:MAG TPA: Gfo/Idh/MocA family oxidoreductase [Gaiellaceae bacterium]|jgi:predicted dehydrogenase|nr:Gfo/Idh/MocA family oxidoreductase [Gaiellaceae bacterium]